MKANCWIFVRVGTALILATVLLVGCGKEGESPQGGSVSEVTVSTGVDSSNRPLNPTSLFAADADGFYCSFKLSGFPAGTEVKAQWIYVGGDPEVEAIVGQNYVMEEQTATTTRGGQGYTATVYAKPPIPDYTWPKGNWKVVIYVNEQEEGSASFKVE